jgi:hypothetical protein
MPYTLEKGPYFSVVEDFANDDPARMVTALKHLRGGGRISAIQALDSTTLDAGPYTAPQLRDHIETHWFGAVKGTSGQWSKQPPFDPQHHPNTGFWQEWYGDAEGVLREGLIRALEVALGVRHGEDPGSRIPRSWRLEVFWRCPIPWFETWVTWRQHGNGPRDGQVTVLISTPGHGHPVKNTPVRQNEPANSGYQLNPVNTGGAPQGMWVVSQAYHRPWPKQITVESGLGEWTFPAQGLGYVSQGPVVVVSPPEREGGVLNPPRQWSQRT